MTCVCDIRNRFGTELHSVFSSEGLLPEFMGVSAEERKYKRSTWRNTRYQCGLIVQYEGKTIGVFHKTG